MKKTSREREKTNKEIDDFVHALKHVEDGSREHVEYWKWHKQAFNEGKRKEEFEEREIHPWNY